MAVVLSALALASGRAKVALLETSQASLSPVLSADFSRVRFENPLFSIVVISGKAARSKKNEAEADIDEIG